jgi:Mrp family chromosome partitioning ATPase
MPTPLSGIEPALSDYLRELRRHWPIVAVTTVVLAGLALGLSLAQDKVYEATTELRIQRTPTRTNLISESPPNMSTELVLARSRSVQSAATARLGFKPVARVHQIGDTEVVRFTAEGRSRALAAKAAAGYAAAFIEARVRLATAPLDATRKELEAKMAGINGFGEGTLDPAQVDELAVVAESVRAAARQRDPDRLRAAVAALDRITGAGGAQTTNDVVRGAALQLLIDEIDAAEALVRNTVPKVVSPARASPSPIRPVPLRTTVVAAALGLMLSAAGLLVRSYLDRVIHDAHTLHAVTGLPVLGVLTGDVARRRGSRRSRSDGARLDLQECRTALQLRGVAESMRAVQLTSPRSVEGMEQLGAELGAAFARLELSVIVVDADFRRPRPSGTPAGLSSLAPDDIDTVLAASPAVDGVRHIPAGAIPEDPAAFLGSRRFRDLVTDLRRRADVVFLVAPPVLESPDPMLISRAADATVLITAGATRAVDAAEAVARLGEFRHAVLGTVLAGPARRARSELPRSDMAIPPPGHANGAGDPAATPESSIPQR